MAELGSDYLNANYIAPSSFSQNGGIIQTVILNDTTQRTQAIAINVITALTGLSAAIAPKRSSNSILIYARWCGEGGTLWNSVFGLQRNGTNIGQPAAQSLQEAGITCPMDTYSANASDNSSTPAQMNFWYRDSPGTTGTVTYQITFTTSVAGGITLATNRTITNSNTANFELPMSALYLFEVSG